MTGTAAVVDDPSIADDDRLLRRVHPNEIIWDDTRKRHRASSAAFDDTYDGVSVFISSVVLTLGMREEDVLNGHEYEAHSLLAVTPGLLRAMDPPLGVIRDPDPPGVPPHPCSAAHGLVMGIPSGKPGLKRYRRPLAENATDFVVLRPPGSPA